LDTYDNGVFETENATEPLITTITLESDNSVNPPINDYSFFGGNFNFFVGNMTQNISSVILKAEIPAIGKDYEVFVNERLLVADVSNVMNLTSAPS
jgi:hypothetical protein